MNDRNCQECSKDLPHWAEFCPFCGSKYRATRTLEPVDASGPIKTEILFLGTTEQGFDETAGKTQALHGISAGKDRVETTAEPVSGIARRTGPKTVRLPADSRVSGVETAEVPRVNPDAVALFDSYDDDLDFETVPLRSRGQLAVVALAMLVTVVALGYGAVLIAGETRDAAVADLAAAELVPAQDESEAKVAPLPEQKPFGVVVDDEKSATVTYGDQEVLEILTAKGSRYDNVTQRAKSVTVRLEHIAKKQRDTRDAGARFVARVNGDRYEVVWDDGSEHPFRVTDVTKHDLKDGDDLSIEANLRADALTDLFRRDIAPVEIPTS